MNKAKAEHDIKLLNEIIGEIGGVELLALNETEQDKIRLVMMEYANICTSVENRLTDFANNQPKIVVGRSEVLTAFNEWIDENHHSFKIPDMILQDYIRYGEVICDNDQYQPKEVEVDWDNKIDNALSEFENKHSLPIIDVDRKKLIQIIKQHLKKWDSQN